MERSDERLSGAESMDSATDPNGERDPAFADTPPADTAAVPPERTDRDVDDGRADPVGDGDVVTDEPTAGSTTHGDAPLLADADGFRARWEEIQVRFVDEPRGAVEDADALVATVMKRLAEGFARERDRLESQWARGEDISTEDLRVALQRYRSFFQRLLST